MWDSNLIFSNNKTISASGGEHNGNSAILDLQKTPATGIWVKIAHTGVVGGAPQSAAQLSAKVQFSDSATFLGTVEDGPDLVVNQNTAGFRVAKLCQSQRRYARVFYTMSGTTPSFTGIYAGVVSGPSRDDPAGVNTY
jgi:hypothetical protein